MSAAAVEVQTPVGAPSGWRYVRPGEWRWERDGAVITYGCRVLVNPKGFVDHVAFTGWSTRQGALPLETTEVRELGGAVVDLMAWLGGKR